MSPNTSTAAQENQEVSPYTVAMSRCLVKLAGGEEGVPERKVVHTLVNLVQGRMLEYLADRICREYAIEDPASRQRIVHVLLRIFSDEFFALFRSKVEFQPALVLQIARRIIRQEFHPAGGPGLAPRQRPDRLYPAIFRKYFEYRNLGILLELVESDAEIQKIILLTLLKRQRCDPALLERVAAILDEDQEGVAPTLFLGYLSEGDPATLAGKVRNGAWKTELEAMRRRMAHLRGD
jgi:hypothetical protein